MSNTIIASSVQMPSIWYEIGLHCKPSSDACPYEVTGFSFAGVPGVVIGHNEKTAWGFTNVGPDVMDLYIERVNPENANQYEVNGKWENMTLREEIISVAGGESVGITIRATRHGPVISDSYAPLMQSVKKPEGDAPLKGILQAVEEPLVSIDYKGDPHSSSVDLPFTMVLGKAAGTLLKIVAWYDNEWGYSVRTPDLAALMAKSL